MSKLEPTRKRSILPRQAKPVSVSVIGAGRVGTAFAIALWRSGYSINLVVAKHAANARRAAHLAGGTAIGLSARQFHKPSESQRRLLRSSNVVLIAVPDDTIETVAKELTHLLASGHQDPVVLHTSGAVSSKALAPLQSKGISIGSLHPLVSISDPARGAVSLNQAYFSVEGDRAAVQTGKRIARDLGGEAFVIRSETKPLYHAAALMASPNLTALIDIALEMLGGCGLSANQSRKVLLPLVRSTLDNLVKQNPAGALTGTFKRGDVATVKKHLAAISASRLNDALDAYVLLGRRSLKLTSLKRARLTEIERALAGALKRPPRS